MKTFLQYITTRIYSLFDVWWICFATIAAINAHYLAAVLAVAIGGFVSAAIDVLSAKGDKS